MPSPGCELDERVRLGLAVQPAVEPARVDAVARTSARDAIAPSKPSRLEISSHHLLQRRRRDEDLLATSAVPFRAVERFAIDERLQHGLPRLRGDLPHERAPAALEGSTSRCPPSARRATVRLRTARRRAVRSLPSPCGDARSAHACETSPRARASSSGRSASGRGRRTQPQILPRPAFAPSGCRSCGRLSHAAEPTRER